jgi:hypothetical protein
VTIHWVCISNHIHWVAKHLIYANIYTVYKCFLSIHSLLYHSSTCWLCLQRSLARFHVLITGTLSAHRLPVYCFVPDWQEHTTPNSSIVVCIHSNQGLVLDVTWQRSPSQHFSDSKILTVRCQVTLLPPYECSSREACRDTANSSVPREISLLCLWPALWLVPQCHTSSNTCLSTSDMFSLYSLQNQSFIVVVLVRVVCSTYHSPLGGAPLLVCFCHRWSQAVLMGTSFGGWIDIVALCTPAWWMALEPGSASLPPPGGLPAMPIQVYHCKLLPPHYCPSYWGMNKVMPQGALRALLPCLAIPHGIPNPWTHLGHAVYPAPGWTQLRFLWKTPKSWVGAALCRTTVMVCILLYVIRKMYNGTVYTTILKETK